MKTPAWDKLLRDVFGDDESIRSFQKILGTALITIDGHCPTNELLEDARER